MVGGGMGLRWGEVVVSAKGLERCRVGGLLGVGVFLQDRGGIWRDLDHGEDGNHFGDRVDADEDYVVEML